MEHLREYLHNRKNDKYSYYSTYIGSAVGTYRFAQHDIVCQHQPSHHCTNSMETYTVQCSSLEVLSEDSHTSCLLCSSDINSTQNERPFLSTDSSIMQRTCYRHQSRDQTDTTPRASIHNMGISPYPGTSKPASNYNTCYGLLPHTICTVEISSHVSQDGKISGDLVDVSSVS